MQDIYVVAVRSNPLRWQRPESVAKDWVQHILDSGARLVLAEIQYGDRPYVHADTPHVLHVPLRAKTWCWSKECALNLAIARVPQAQKIIVSDADVFQRRAGWVREAGAALDHYDVIQTWDAAYDLGPNDEHIQLHHSFCKVLHEGGPVVPDGEQFWKFNGGPYDYPHPGFQWGYTRQALDWVGGLFEVGGMGSGDHHMALALAGAWERSLPAAVSDSYRAHLRRWANRAMHHINHNVGFVHGTIEHRFHGRKADRGYLSRWGMFMQHGFDPDTDLKRNTFGVFEWAGNKPQLRREFDRYLRSRNEDVNSL